jgi:hypothetical protein
MAYPARGGKGDLTVEVKNSIPSGDSKPSITCAVASKAGLTEIMHEAEHFSDVLSERAVAVRPTGSV